MDYVIIDLEFNNLQGVYKNKREYLNRENSSKRHLYPNEIIQIGAVRLNDALEETGQLNRIVKNRFYETVNPVITEMTGVTQDMMDKGMLFPEAVRELEQFCEGAQVLTWGISDIYEIIRNCHMHQTPIIVLGQSYLDLQTWIGQKVGENRTPSLKSAMEAFHVEVDDEMLHDGFYDAQSTAKVMVEAIRKYGRLEGFKSSKVLFSSDSIFISDIKVRDIPDNEVTMICPLCNGHIVYDISMNNEHGKVRSMYHCEECQGNFIEDLQVKENMLGDRTFFKKIKKVPRDYFRTIIGQRQRRRNEKF